jgi:hypothetical protein
MCLKYDIRKNINCELCSEKKLKNRKRRNKTSICKFSQQVGRRKEKERDEEKNKKEV